MSPEGALQVIFSPSDTQDWLRCPIYRQFKRTWDLPASQWTPNMLLGTSLHACMAAFFMNKPDVLEIGQVTLVEGYVEQDTWPIEELGLFLTHSWLALEPQVQAIKNTEDILGIETNLLPDGDISHTRADLVSQTTDGLTITDLKFSLEIPPQYRSKRLTEYDASFQLWCYAYWAQKKYDLKAAWLRVLQVIGQPKATALIHVVRVTPERLAFWLKGAEQAWVQMTHEVEPAPNFTSCYSKYGKCIAYDPCHVAHGDEKMIQAMGFTRKEAL